MVLIPQSRKALLPPRRRARKKCLAARFQSLSREKPFCHTAPRARERAVQVGFNRSVAKSHFATSSARYSLRASLEIQSLSREKPFCLQQCHVLRACFAGVSIAQSRKALLPRSVVKRSQSQSESVSIAQSRKALLPRRLSDL